MASFTSSVFGPFRNTYRYLQHQSHANPVIFYSLLIGSLGPISVLAVPPIRRAYGWKPTEPIPTSYPLPQRERQQVTAYDDEE